MATNPKIANFVTTWK